MTRPHRRSLLWQSACILLPLFALAGLALWQLRASREVALNGAREAAESFVANLDSDALPPPSSLRPHPPVKLPLNRSFTPGDFLYSLSPIPTENRTPYQEYLKTLQNLAPKDPDETTTAAKELAESYACEKLDQLLEDFPDALTDSGLPLAPLMGWELARLAKFDLARVGAMLESAVVTHPSILTPELLQRMTEQLGESHPLIQRFTPRWLDDEQFRFVLRNQSAAIERMAAPGWLVQPLGSNDAEQYFWAHVRPGQDVVLVDDYALGEHLVDSFERDAERLPEHLGAEVSLGGRLLSATRGELEPLASADRGPWRISAGISDRHALLATVRTQTNAFLIAIALATCAAILGLLSLRRSYARQLELGELKSNFVASVSHELRAPVASVRLLAERLRSGKVTDESKRDEYYGFIEGESRRLGTLVENILDFSRIERGQKEYHFAQTDLAALVRDTTGTMEHYAAERGVTLAREIKGDETTAEADAEELRQALVNLIDNAIKFSPDGSKVVVGVSADDDTARLTVTDSGPGVPAGERRKIFERFYRSGSELTRETQGAGIGLSIVRHIAEGHGGEVSVECPPGGGSSFTLSFPAHRSHV